MSNGISLKALILRFISKITLTWGLVILEGLAIVSTPAAIGYAINDLVHKKYTGLFVFCGLCFALLVIGSVRRFYDTRAYASIYQTVIQEITNEERNKKTPLSKTSARVILFTEFIDFLENSLPNILLQFINLFGALFIILLIDVKIFLACLATIATTGIVYTASKSKIFRLTRAANNQLERQLNALTSRKKSAAANHFSKLMFWRIHLSDLETGNFSFIWAAISGTLIYTIITVTQSSATGIGELVSAVMYVFGLAESLMTLPLYYQQLIRLQEIATRLILAAPHVETAATLSLTTKETSYESITD